ncbi:hypothetical protein V1512DRAFT_270907 [Lipomyces arxii]|uniref:uncharacterized protein n=1 Tax=Lipomyces arxii TaxID=56418 RepID=UPI0034CD35E5
MVEENSSKVPDEQVQIKPQTSQVTTEEILTMLKRRGLFDSLRKSVFTDFKDSPTNKTLISAIESIVETDSSNAPSQNRGKAAALLEGSVNRSKEFGDVNKYIDERVSVSNDELRSKVEAMVKDIFAELSASQEKSSEEKSKEDG